MFSALFLYLLSLFSGQEIRAYRHMEVACVQVSVDVVECDGVK